MQQSYNRGRRLTADGQAARYRMLEQRGWLRLSGGKWVSPYTGISYDDRGALDIEQLRGNWARKMAAAFV